MSSGWRPGPVAWHEGAHCASFLLMGVPVERVRIDGPREGVAGRVELDWADGGGPADLEQARAILVGIVVGGLTSGRAGWTQWPLNPACVAYGSRSYARKARRIAELLDYDEDDWRLIVELAHTMGNLPEYRRLLVR